jgi:hypothetical protein
MVEVAKPYVLANEIQSTLAAAWTRGTSTAMTLVDGTGFPSGGGYVRVGDDTSFALMEYTGRTGDDQLDHAAAGYCTLGVVVSVGDETKEWPIGTVVARVWMAEEAAELITGPASATDGHFLKADGTTGKKAKAEAIAAAELPDAQTAATLTARSAAGLGLYNDGGDGLFVNDAGIVTASKQSAARAGRPSASGVQYIPPVAVTLIFLDDVSTAPSFDVQGEFNVTVLSGSATSTSANHLVDTGAAFVAADVGRTVWNTTDNTYARITARNSGTDVTLDADIMANGEGYKAAFSRFTALAAGVYGAIGALQTETMTDGKLAYGYVYKNGAAVVANIVSAGTADNLAPNPSCFVRLEIGDYLDLRTYHTNAAALGINGGVGRIFLSIVKVA